jgi:hypothetical protein
MDLPWQLHRCVGIGTIVGIVLALRLYLYQSWTFHSRLPQAAYMCHASSKCSRFPRPEDWSGGSLCSGPIAATSGTSVHCTLSYYKMQWRSKAGVYPAA